MDIEKLKPWNWFKHEDDVTNQVPVVKKDATGEYSSTNKPVTTPPNQAFGYLMQLHQEMDRLFDDVWKSFGVASRSRLMGPTSVLSDNLLDNSLFNNPLFNNNVRGDYHAKLDVSGSEKSYEISIDLPGLSEDDIQIELNDNILTIKGQKEEKNEAKDKQYYRVERHLGYFQRTLSLPEDANRDEISANMKNGLLVIEIPRKALPKDNVKRISISS